MQEEWGHRVAEGTWTCVPSRSDVVDLLSRNGKVVPVDLGEELGARPHPGGIRDRRPEWRVGAWRQGARMLALGTAPITCAGAAIGSARAIPGNGD